MFMMKWMHVLLYLILVCIVMAGNLSVDISVAPISKMHILLTPAEFPIVRGVGETLILTCSVLPTFAAKGNYTNNVDLATSHSALLQDVMEHAKMDKDTTSAESSMRSVDASVLHWIMPINAPERVHEERLGVSGVAGMVSARVQVHALRETDSGNYTCELPQRQLAAVAVLQVVHRDVVQQCGLSSFQCSTGECIPERFVCDAKPDCPHATDELPRHCGTDVCSGKLQCDNGRCMAPVRCCRPPYSPPDDSSILAPHQPPHPPNCSINPAIRCCRQLMHPAALDQDLYYLAMRPRPHQGQPHVSTRPSAVLVGCLVAVTLCLMLLLLRHYSRRSGPATTTHTPHGFGRGRDDSWWREPCSPAHHALLRLLCRSRCPPSSSYARPPHADAIALTSVNGGGDGSLIAPPQFCRVPPANTPPPSYHAVCGPPPPYCADMNSVATLPLLTAPVSTSTTFVSTYSSAAAQSRMGCNRHYSRLGGHKCQPTGVAGAAGVSHFGRRTCHHHPQQQVTSGSGGDFSGSAVSPCQSIADPGVKTAAGHGTKYHGRNHQILRGVLLGVSSDANDFLPTTEPSLGMYHDSAVTPLLPSVSYAVTRPQFGRSSGVVLKNTQDQQCPPARTSISSHSSRVSSCSHNINSCQRQRTNSVDQCKPPLEEAVTSKDDSSCSGNKKKANDSARVVNCATASDNSMDSVSLNCSDAARASENLSALVLNSLREVDSQLLESTTKYMKEGAEQNVPHIDSFSNNNKLKLDNGITDNNNTATVHASFRRNKAYRESSALSSTTTTTTSTNSTTTTDPSIAIISTTPNITNSAHQHKARSRRPLSQLSASSSSSCLARSSDSLSTESSLSSSCLSSM